MTTADNTARKLDQIDLSSTARIDRRQTVLAQLEAALLADKLAILETREERNGTDPYNTFRPRSTAWNKRSV